MGAQAVRLSNVDIDNALKNKDFEVIFQPVFDLGNGALARVETFVRWRHPALGVLPPGAFISFFESQGRMSELTRYVLAEALDAYLDWRGPYAPGFSINLALSDLTDDAFASHFIKLMRDKDFPADLVTLECPMPPVDQDLKAAAAQFERLSLTGARLAIEVRGRANDFLRSIAPFPFQEIKTGGSAILRFARTVRGPGLSAIADLLDIANKSNAAITAVGVEDQASLSALRGLGFTAAQGNHLAKVGSLSEFLPARVNDVRDLLGLEPLEKNELAALFRTESPSLASSTPKAAASENENTIDDALVERLNERVTRQRNVESASNSQTPSAMSKDSPVNAETPAKKPISDEERKLRARAKAKALVLAKRAKAREALKAAAIERAKLKSIAPEGGAAERTAITKQQSVEEPRALQERISREFASTDREALSIPEQESYRDTQLGTEATKTQQGEKSAPIASPNSDATRSTLDDVLSAKLHIEKSSAYFQPGVRVGNPQLSPATTNPSLPTSEPPVQDRQADFADLSREVGRVSKTERQIDAETFRSATQPVADIVQGDLLDDQSLEGTTVEAVPLSAKDPGKNRKPFLKRTVIAYPKYFWPKSIRRRMRKAKQKSTDRIEAEQS